MPGVSRNVFVLGLVSLATDVASEMVYPLIPIFLTVTLGAPVAALGAIEGIAEGTASLMKVGSGWYSDRLAMRQAAGRGGLRAVGGRQGAGGDGVSLAAGAGGPHRRPVRQGGAHFAARRPHRRFRPS